MTRIFTYIAAGVIVVLLGALWLMTQVPNSDDPFQPCRTTRVAGGLDAIGGPFELVNHHGETVTQDDVITGPTILYFGYTFCPDICPTDNVRNAMAVDLLAEMGHDVTPVFISIDPERDTPERMADFVFNMHEDMIGLTGTPEQVRAASLAYKTYFQREVDGDPDYYLVDHSTFAYFAMPDYGTVEIFGRDTTPQQMADQLACFIDAAE